MTQSVRDLIRSAVAELGAAGVPDPAGDARRLLAHVLGARGGVTSLTSADQVSPDQAAKFFTFITARRRRQPVSQIIGRRAFWTLEFAINPQVLDPRPETEVLVQQALADDYRNILDLGTGSGCIVLCLLHENPAARAVAVDTSAGALDTTKKNATALGMTERLTLLSSDWFTHVQGQFDLIVCNPPYIRLDEMPGLSDEIRLFEPVVALTPGPDGLESFRQIAANIMDHLAPAGRALFEIGPDQAAAVITIFAAVGLKETTVHSDLDGRDRVVAFRRAR